jgi:hypothetical protein
MVGVVDDEEMPQPESAEDFVSSLEGGGVIEDVWPSLHVRSEIKPGFTIRGSHGEVIDIRIVRIIFLEGTPVDERRDPVLGPEERQTKTERGSESSREGREEHTQRVSSLKTHRHASVSTWRGPEAT